MFIKKKKKNQINTTFKLFVKIVFWIHVSNPTFKLFVKIVFWITLAIHYSEDSIFSFEIIQQKL